MQRLQQRLWRWMRATVLWSAAVVVVVCWRLQHRHPAAATGTATATATVTATVTAVVAAVAAVAAQAAAALASCPLRVAVSAEAAVVMVAGGLPAAGSRPTGTAIITTAVPLARVVVTLQAAAVAAAVGTLRRCLRPPLQRLRWRCCPQPLQAALAPAALAVWVPSLRWQATLAR